MNGTVLNKEKFLSKISAALGRTEIPKSVERPKWKHNVQWEVMNDFTNEQLVEVLVAQCQNIHTEATVTTKENLGSVVKEIINRFEGKSVLTSVDERFEQYNLDKTLEEIETSGINTYKWNKSMSREDNIGSAAATDFGITFSSYTMAESGTVTLCASDEFGRSVSLLPPYWICIIPKETIVPRFTQVADVYHKMAQRGERIPTSLNFVSGPSNSADIEMNLVVGVHGPIKAFYIIVD
jgi:L-lactate dehydrogenase complex protein LldG